MRKVFLRIGRVFAGIVLILGACVKPVSVGPFPDIIGERTGTTVDPDIGFEEPENIPPELAVDGIPVDEDGTVNVALGGTVTVTVTNADIYGTIEWYCEGRTAPVAGDTFIVDTAGYLFGVEGVYPVTVTGEKDGVSYSKLFFVDVG